MISNKRNYCLILLLLIMSNYQYPTLGQWGHTVPNSSWSYSFSMQESGKDRVEKFGRMKVGILYSIQFKFQMWDTGDASWVAINHWNITLRHDILNPVTITLPGSYFDKKFDTNTIMFDFLPTQEMYDKSIDYGDYMSLSLLITSTFYYYYENGTIFETNMEVGNAFSLIQPNDAQTTTFEWEFVLFASIIVGLIISLYQITRKKKIEK